MSSGSTLALLLTTFKKVAELAAAHLLLRVSPPERLDGPPMYKCGISYDVALALGRDLRVPMLDLIWEAS